jgi:tRNA (guanine37-N1)-methyltransferase
MRIDVVTAFPDMIRGPVACSMTGRAVKQNLVRINVHDLRKWTADKHRTIDDSPYGGGAGMIFKVGPLYESLSDLTGEGGEKLKIVLTSPRGRVFTQQEAIRLSLIDHLIIICGHYKGVDERIKNFFPIDEISIGDFVLSGGEIPALVLTDAIVRLIPGVLGDMDSAFTDSFSENLLDCEYFTRPEDFRGAKVPDVLMSGDHKKIEAWRHQRREEITKANRPDLFKKYINESNHKK